MSTFGLIFQPNFPQLLQVKVVTNRKSCTECCSRFFYRLDAVPVAKWTAWKHWSM